MSMTLRNFYDDVYRIHHHLASPPGTLVAFRGEINGLQKFFDLQLAAQGLAPRPVLLDDLSDELVAGAMEWKLNKLDCAVPTANKLLRTIKALWNFARRKKYLTTVPDLDRLKEPQREPEAWSLDELQRILLAASQRVGKAPRKGMVGEIPADLWWPALILMIANTGVRISAIMAIESAKLNLATGEVFVKAETQKQNADQRFELKPEVVQVLALIQPWRHRCVFDDWPFDRQKSLSWPALEDHYEQILAAAGLPTTRHDKFHKLRKTFATFICAEAGPIVAQAMLGHSHMSVTKRYLDKSKLPGQSARDLLPTIPFPAALRQRLLPLPAPDNAA